MKPGERKAKNSKLSVESDLESEKASFLEFECRTVSESDIKEREQYDPPLARFGVQVRLKRRIAGYNPLEFAHKTGMEIETLTAIEFGYASPADVALNINKISDGLGIPKNAIHRFLNYLWNEK